MQGKTWTTIVLVAVVAVPAAAEVKTYKIDPEHTSVTFRIRHLLTYVEGRFKEFEGTIRFDPANPEAPTIKGAIKVASIDTNVKERDEHLRSSDFFNVAEFPDITFESTKVTDVDKEKMTAKLHGNLTIRGVTKPVVLDVAFLGEAVDPWSTRRRASMARLPSTGASSVWSGTSCSRPDGCWSGTTCACASTSRPQPSNELAADGAVMCSPMA